MKRLLFILFYFQLAWLFGQQIPGLNGTYVAFPEKNGFRFIDKEFSYFTTDATVFKKSPHSFEIHNLQLDYLYFADKIRLLSAGGGVVHEYHNDSLYRIDKSFEFKSRFNSYNFVRGDSILSIGGTGEFNVQNNILYFTDISREWLLESRFDYRDSYNRLSFGQYHPTTNRVFFSLNDPSDGIVGKSLREVQNINPTTVYSYHFGTKSLKAEYNLTPFYETVFSSLEPSNLTVFNNYRLPLIISDSELIAFDFSEGIAYRYLEADVNVLLQYKDVLAYNPSTSDFLLAYGQTVDPHFLVINEAKLLGTEYEVIELKRANAFPWWLSVLILPLGIFVFMKRRSVPLVESLDRITPKLRRVLSEEDFKIFQIIREQYPNGVEYPDLQSSFERELSYESRIKKLRNTIAHIDETAQSIIGKSSSIFRITKGKEDKRVKVIRVNDEEVFQYWWIKKASKNI